MQDVASFLPPHYSIAFLREPHSWLFSAIFHDYRFGNISPNKTSITLDDLKIKLNNLNLSNYSSYNDMKRADYRNW